MPRWSDNTARNTRIIELREKHGLQYERIAEIIGNGATKNTCASVVWKWRRKLKRQKVKNGETS